MKFPGVTKSKGRQQLGNIFVLAMCGKPSFIRLIRQRVLSQQRFSDPAGTEKHPDPPRLDLFL